MDESDFVLAYLNTIDTAQPQPDHLVSAADCERFFKSQGLARADVDWEQALPQIRDTRDQLRSVFQDLTVENPDYAGLSQKLNSALSFMR